MAEKTFPELIFGIVAPIGANIDSVCESLAMSLKMVDYQVEVIHLTKLMDFFDEPAEPTVTRTTYEKKIHRGNQLRRIYGNAILADLAMLAIKTAREKFRLDRDGGSTSSEDQNFDQQQKTAYIIRQLKHPAEIETLKRVYGQKFIQVSATQPMISLEENLTKKLTRDHPELLPAIVAEESARLIRTDREEDQDKNHPGQKLQSIFHRADVFIRSDSEKSTKDTCSRFIRAFFGDTTVSPNRDEFGSFMAKVAAMRSVDLSRQVGAAIMTERGEIVSVGCNDVPKFGGGIYTTDDDEPHRDIDIQYEGNKAEIAQMVHSFIDDLKGRGIITSNRTAQEIVAANPRLIDDSMIGEITEYGRMTHAEMTAICEAARLGRPLKDCTIFVTTFPCHNCTKHIVASGIERVVYIEPYQKSRAEKLHGDAVEIQGRPGNKVQFEPFAGISPARFREIFEKGKRRNEDGTIKKWIEDVPIPVILARDSAHVGREMAALKTSSVQGMSLSRPS